MIARELLKSILPPPARRRLRDSLVRADRFLRRFKSDANLSSLRRTVPLRPSDFGESRGQCIDRYYIEKFLTAHAGDVRGRVLEIADYDYARRFGGGNVTQVDAMHVATRASAPEVSARPSATIFADLAQGAQFPNDAFDCILCIQALQYVYDLRAAARTMYSLLKPGGVVLVTAPGFQRLDYAGAESGQEYWRFTHLSLRRLFEEAFPAGQIEVEAQGNVTAAVAYLYGFAAEDLRLRELDYQDQEFEVLIGLRATKSGRPGM